MGANVKALKSRIRSVDSTLHLTRAMGLVASSKMRRAGEAMTRSREYANAFSEAMALLAEKRRQSLVGYNLDACDPTAPETCLPKQFHLTGGEFKSQLHAAVECYDSREDDYKRRASALLHSFLLQTAHEHLLAKNSVQGRKIRKSDVIAEQLLRYLNQNYTKHLTSREIEELFEGNFDYLNRVFSSLTGSPVFAYLNILRINNAKQLISTTDLPFSEIAYLVGIEDRYYFSKLFRKMTGMSPTEYYKEVRS